MGTNIDQYLTPEEHELLDHSNVPGSGGGTISSANEVSHGFVVGQPIYFSGATSGWELAQADADATTADALVFSVQDADNFRYIQAGELELTTGEWDAVTGGSGGLTSGEHYRLDDAAPGTMTDAAAGGGISQFLLRALSATKALVYMGEPHAGVATGSVKVSQEGVEVTGSPFTQLEFGANSAGSVFDVTDQGGGVAQIEMVETVILKPSDISTQAEFQAVLNSYRHVILTPGTYSFVWTGPIALPDSLFLEGWTRNTGNQPTDNDHARIFPSSGTPGTDFMQSQGNDFLRMSNIVFEMNSVGGEGANDHVLDLTAGEWHQLDNLIIKNWGLGVTDAYAININSGTVKNCSISGCGGGVRMENNESYLDIASIEHCYFDNINPSAGVEIENSSDHIIICNNVFRGGGGHGVLGGSNLQNVHVHKNFFDTLGDNSIDGFLNATDGTMIIYNSIVAQSGGSFAIRLDAASGTNRARCENNIRRLGPGGFSLPGSWSLTGNNSAS